MPRTSAGEYFSDVEKVESSDSEFIDSQTLQQKNIVNVVAARRNGGEEPNV